MEVILLILGILNAILLYKIWSMTNNVWFIKELLKNQNRSKESSKIDERNSYHLEMIARILANQYPEAAKKAAEEIADLDR